VHHLWIFCFGKDEIGIRYTEAVEQVDPAHIFLLPFIGECLKEIPLSPSFPLPENQWASEPCPVKLGNLLRRGNVYGDLMQGETESTINLALRQSNNNVPRATRILKKKRNVGQYFPPAVLISGNDRYQPAPVKIALQSSSLQSLSCPSTARLKIPTPTIEVARRLFSKIDKDNDGFLSRDDVKELVSHLYAAPGEDCMTSWFDHFDSNGDGRISFEEFLDALGNQPTCTANEWHAFFRVLDIDDNGKVTIHEMSNTLESLGYVFF